MGIYIKNMNMPTCCSACPLEKAVFENGRKKLKDAYCRITGGTTISNVVTRRTDCPLLEVKRPHGRLVDADQFLKDMRDLYADHSWDWREVHFSMLDTEMNLLGRTVIGAEGEDD